MYSDGCVLRKKDIFLDNHHHHFPRGCEQVGPFYTERTVTMGRRAAVAGGGTVLTGDRDRADYATWKVAALRRTLKHRGLSTAGLKAQLVPHTTTRQTPLIFRFYFLFYLWALFTNLRLFGLDFCRFLMHVLLAFLSLNMSNPLLSPRRILTIW